MIEITLDNQQKRKKETFRENNQAFKLPIYTVIS